MNGSLRFRTVPYRDGSLPEIDPRSSLGNRVRSVAVEPADTLGKGLK